MLSGERVRIAKQLIPSITVAFGLDKEQMGKLESLVVSALKVEVEDVRQAQKLDIIMREQAVVKAAVSHILLAMLTGQPPQPHPDLLKMLGIEMRERSRIVVPG